MANEHFKHDSLSLNTFKLNLTRLTQRVEASISSVLSGKICGIFEGETTLKAHDVEVFAVFSAFDNLGLKDTRFAPFHIQKETTQNTMKQIQIQTFVLNRFGGFF